MTMKNTKDPKPQPTPAVASSNLLADDLWTWTKEKGLAVLREHFRDGETRYNEQSIRAALANAQARRHEYATKEAWQRQLRKFASGVACIVG